ncbi:hypothetical protein PIB30_041265 [Stylosanthes scabra]|uniref:Serine-rich protein-like protein n=1 Tax=Stylosanthes scabra TaxID=79078 RepID=A0ABU6VDP0_9FABA|nr:hypothetical protein [Stylosanthes scabra]
MAAVASPSSRNQTPSTLRSVSSAFASYTNANFSPGASPLIPTRSPSSSSFGHHHRSSSPSLPPPATSSSVRFSLEQRPGSPGQRSMTVTKNERKTGAVASSTSNHQRRTCMCSPTTHPGSFRCSYHKRVAEQQKQTASIQCASSSSGNTLNLRRCAMQNSLVRIGGVEGEVVKRALSALIRPSSHNHRRREAFQPRPSRLSVMSKAQDW